MPTIGLTGNFGMGKSTVLNLFGKLGASTISADNIVHKVLDDPYTIGELSRLLGKDVLAGDPSHYSLNKKRIADIIFNDQAKREAVERIIHPEVLKSIKREVSEILGKDPSAVIIIEVPLLFESGYDINFDKNIVVYCSRAVAMKRLSQKGFSNKESAKRMKAQMPITEKKSRADFLINNDGDLEKTKLRVKELYNSFIPG